MFIFFILNFIFCQNEIQIGFNKFNDNINLNFGSDLNIITNFGNLNLQSDYIGNVTIFDNKYNLNDNFKFNSEFNQNNKIFGFNLKSYFVYVADNYSNFSDSRLRNSKLLPGMFFKIDELNLITANIGWDNHLQLDEESNKLAYDMQMFINQTYMDWQYIGSSNLFYTNRSIDREERKLNLNNQIEYKIDTNNFKISLDYYSNKNNFLRRNETENYSIELREEDNYNFTFGLNYHLLKNYSINSKFSYNDYSRGNSFRDFDIIQKKTGGVEFRNTDSYLLTNILNYRNNSLNFNLKFDNFYENFKNLFLGSDNLTIDDIKKFNEDAKLLDYINSYSRITLNGEILFNKLMINNLFSIEINRTDTPSDNDNRDRDLQIIRFLNSINYKFDENFIGGLNFEGRFRHLVYLKEEYSADNNWERIIRLNPYFKFSLNNFFMQPQIEIFVNYKSYDNTDISTTIRSDAQRILRMNDSVSYKFSNEYLLKVNYYYLYRETGRFIWETFTQSIDEVKNEFFGNILVYYTEPEYIFGLGIRYYFLDNERKTIFGFGNANNFYSLSPEVDISLKFYKYSRIELKGWYEFQYYLDKNINIPNFLLQTIFSF